MARHIPKVRTWRVCARDAGGQLLGVVYVDTITARFARWEGRDRLLVALGAERWVHEVTRVTASPAPDPRRHFAADCGADVWVSA